MLYASVEGFLNVPVLGSTAGAAGRRGRGVKGAARHRARRRGGRPRGVRQVGLRHGRLVRRRDRHDRGRPASRCAVDRDDRDPAPGRGGGAGLRRWTPTAATTTGAPWWWRRPTAARTTATPPPGASRCSRGRRPPAPSGPSGPSPSGSAATVTPTPWTPSTDALDDRAGPVRCGAPAGWPDSGLLSLAMINVAAMVSPRNLPMMAEYGWSLIFFVLVAVILFLIPVSLAISELATAWPRRGGVYPWVKEAFRGRAGFLAVWCDWSENLVWFPTVLSFTATSLAYAIDPSLANSKYLPGLGDARDLLGHHPGRLPRGRGDERDRLDRDDPGRDRPGDPRDRPRRGLPGGRQQLEHPVLGRRPDPQPRPHQPRLPRGRDPDVRRDGGGGLPRRPGPRPGPGLPAGDPAGGGDHGGVHDPRVAGAGGRRAAARDQPRGRRDAGLPGGLRRPRGGLAAGAHRDPGHDRRRRPHGALDHRAGDGPRRGGRPGGDAARAGARRTPPARPPGSCSSRRSAGASSACSSCSSRASAPRTGSSRCSPPRSSSSCTR